MLTCTTCATSLVLQERVQRAGGRIIVNGCARVMGMLSMTRAIGDTALQRFGITPNPELRVVPRSASDEFLLIASDGLWGVLSNEEAVSVTRRCLNRASNKGMTRTAAARIAARVLVYAALKLGSRDNITVLVVDLAREGSRPSSPQTPACGTQLVPNYHLARSPMDLPHPASSQGQQAVEQGPATHRTAHTGVPTSGDLQVRSQVDEQSASEGCCGLLSAEKLLVQVPFPEVPLLPVLTLQQWPVCSRHQGLCSSLIQTQG